MIVAADCWHPCRSTLSVGRNQCSSVVDDQDRLLVVGGGNSNSGEIMRWNPGHVSPSRSNIAIPGQKGRSNTTAGSSMVLLKNKRLYQIFRNNNNGHDDLYTASVDHNGLLNDKSNLWSGVVQWMFQSFWTQSVPLETCDAALTSDGARYLYAVGGFVPHYPSGYQMNWLPTAISGQRVSRAVRKLDTQRPNLAWMEVPNLPQGRRDTAAVVCGSYLYVIGGRGSNGKALSSVLRLNLSSSSSSSPSCQSSFASSSPPSWEETAPLKKGARYGMTAIALHNRYIVVAGGYGQLQRLKTVEYYDTMTNQWSSLPDMLEGRMNCSLSFRAKSNQLVVAGGTTGWGVIPLQSLETLQIHLHQYDNNAPPPRPPPTAPVQAQVVDTTPQLSPPPPTVPVAQAVGTAPVVYADAVVLGEDVVSSTGSTRIATGSVAVASAPTKEEVYGLFGSTTTTTTSPVPPPTAPAVPSSEDKSCAVCLERPKSVAFLCGHQICTECSPLLQDCHSCRRPILGRIRLYD